jgi:hypothetical protein
MRFYYTASDEFCQFKKDPPKALDLSPNLCYTATVKIKNVKEKSYAND